MESYFKDKKILITGGLGFIGSTLAHRLVRMGADIYLIDSLIPEYGGNNFNIDGIEDKVKVNIADVRDKHSMDYLVKGKDVIFNLAGTLSHIDSMKDPFTDLEINCRSQLSILESCRKNNKDVKIVFAGTRGQYGKANYLPVDEKHPMHPTDVNGINNVAGESYHILYNNIYGIKAVSLRLTNTYGPRHQMKHHKQGIINWFIRQLIDCQTVKLYGDGKQIRDINYVDDVIEALLLVACSEKVNGEVFNLGGIPKSLVDLVKIMISVYGKGNYELIPFREDLKRIEVGDYVANYEKIKTTVKWQPKTSLEEGLRLTFDYYEKYKKHYW
ncbi:MAG: NAD-dependent epimerase/dehydratase family protein [Candidatus Scalindua sediminis]|nr:NAD-dependent epimerase/dehydratase family protein [Candidatus Scalindua sediminis]HDY68487.1 NAD-dependent epimerase/dehydratase family protein [Candidatus Scalindua sp.]